MKVKNLTIKRWKMNHSLDHDDIWCRELYPFHVFSCIDFDECKLNSIQKIEFNRLSYYVNIKKIELQDNNRYRTTFDISTIPHSKKNEWKNRRWDTTFQIVYTVTFDFITVFTKKEDPSKDYVVRFMKGNFNKINENRSLPISELLFRTLILQLAEEAFPGGKHNELFKYEPKGVRKLEEHTQFKPKKLDFAPIYSVKRNLWICCSFTEEKAHRLAYYIANQCSKLIVVYCNPNYTKHHRCNYASTSIVSLYEFSNILSSEVRIRYENHIRFLQNHLNKSEQYDPNELLEEINNPRLDYYDIQKSDLLEALGVMKIMPSDNQDFFHSLTAINLINAFLTKQRNNKTLKDKETNLFKNMYFFKIYLSNILTDRIEKKDFSVPIYINKDLIIIEIMGFQFSFHNVPINETLCNYRESEYNQEIIWCKKKLQPIAPLLLKYSRAKRQIK